MPPVPRLLQVVDDAFAPPGHAPAQFAREVAAAFGGARFSLAETPPAPAPPEGPVLSPLPGEGTLTAWHAALDQFQPTAVLVQHLGGTSPALLFDLRERGIPYAVFLHDFNPLCPTRHLWHRRQENCSGPGRTGWKCAWCVSGGWRHAPELPLRTLLYRHRPQDWRTALLRAEVLLAPSRFMREFWIEQGAPPERIAVLAPCLESAPADCVGPAAAPAPPRLFYAGGPGLDAGAALLAEALARLRTPVQLVAAANLEAPRLADCAAAVVPLRRPPGFSALAWQAQRTGIPVVATAIGGLTESIIHGVNGYLAAPDDPHALAAALREALRRDPPAWDGALAQRNATALAQASRAKLQRLLELLTQGAVEPDLGLRLDHGDWLTEAAAKYAVPVPSLAQNLAAAMRDEPGAADPNSPLESACSDRVIATSRRRAVALNHAIAFFRACGCRNIAYWPEDFPPDPGTEAPLAAWGLDRVPVTQIPDGILAFAPGDEVPDPVHLRRRFPAARAWVTFSSTGVETIEPAGGI